MGKHTKPDHGGPAAVLTGAIAVVLSVGMFGQAVSVDVRRPDNGPVVLSTRPPLTLAPGAAGGRTELATRVSVSPTPEPVHRSRTVESSPSAPVRDRSTFNPAALPTRTPSPTPTTEPSSEPADDAPAADVEPTCGWER